MANYLKMVLGAVVLVAGVVGCGDADGSSTPATGSTDGGAVEGTVVVFAAASLTDAFAEVESAFEAGHPGVDVVLNLAGSSALRVQILEGAPADVFASANETNMAQVVEAGQVDGAAKVFASNLLQIAVPAGNPAGVTGIDDLANPDLFIGVCTEGVPCGDLAREVLANAGVEASIDTNEPDVRALVTKIEAAELDAGIVYVTDVASSSGRVEGIAIADDVNVVATYPIAQLARSSNPTGAAAFVEFVLSEAGQAILRLFGFDGAVD